MINEEGKERQLIYAIISLDNEKSEEIHEAIASIKSTISAETATKKFRQVQSIYQPNDLRHISFIAFSGSVNELCDLLGLIEIKHLAVALSHIGGRGSTELVNWIKAYNG